jgi:CheY-like chemotaxis protein
MPDQTFVVVAEDEELIRFVIVQALLDEGFEVMEAEHAEQEADGFSSHNDAASWVAQAKRIAIIKEQREPITSAHLREV